MLLADIVPLVLLAAEQGPEPEDVKAGWTALTIFLLGCVAVGLLGWSLVRQLRKAQAAKDAGVYGDAPASSGSERSEGDESGPPDSQ